MSAAETALYPVSSRRGGSMRTWLCCSMSQMRACPKTMTSDGRLSSRFLARSTRSADGSGVATTYFSGQWASGSSLYKAQAAAQFFRRNASSSSAVAALVDFRAFVRSAVALFSRSSSVGIHILRFVVLGRSQGVHVEVQPPLDAHDVPRVGGRFVRLERGLRDDREGVRRAPVDSSFVQTLPNGV